MSARIKTDADRLRDAQDIIRQKNGELVSARKMLNALHKDHDTAEKIRQEIFGLSAHTVAPPDWLAGIGGRPGSRGAPIAIWSDWHYGEVVEPDQVGGVNEFNRRIGRERIKRLTDTTVDLCFNHMGRAKQKYPGIVVCLGGDMISGDIHEELAETNDRTSPQSVNDLVDYIGASLEVMASKFGRVFVPCVVGNHGRTTKKFRMKNRIFTSYDWTIYVMLEKFFRKEKRITMMVPNETDANFKVFGHRFMLTHGDDLGVKGGDGIIGALGPIMRGALKTSRSEMQIGRQFDTLLIGHWHQYLTLPGLVVNNSLKGYDEYARLALRAPYSRPSQALFFCHPEHGITAHWQVYVDGKRSATDKNWVSWQ
jgi:hypothetical protein